MDTGQLLAFLYSKKAAVEMKNPVSLPYLISALSITAHYLLISSLFPPKNIPFFFSKPL
jgi:hypothetical protein